MVYFPRSFNTRRNLLFLFLIAFALLFIDTLVVLDRLQGERLYLTGFHEEIPEIKVVPYKQLFRGIVHETAASCLEKTKQGLFISIGGFVSLPLQDLPKELKKESLHPSYSLGLYSMEYARDLLESYDKTRDPKELEILISVTEAMLDRLETFAFIPDLLAYNEHAIAERVEFFLLFKAKLQEENTHPELVRRLNKHLVHSARLLIDDSRFIWISNHGLMQIRALLRIASAMPEAVLGKECLAVAERRIRQVLPYFIADDGAILESATGYWIFIYKLWSNIAQDESLSSELRYEIKSRLIKAKKFIETVTNHDGFLQGTGDSKNHVVTDDAFVRNTTNRAFAFSDGIAGISYAKDSKVYSLLFVTLDTPPNIHKLPEDLAVYIYAGRPIFVNTGTFAYDKSPERKFILSEVSQMTVSFVENYPGYTSTITRTDENDNSEIVFEGRKTWANKDAITRFVKFDSLDGSLEIADNSDREIVSRYNLHPDITLEDVTDESFCLKGEGISLKFKYTGTLEIHESWISLSPLDKTPIKQLIFRGNKVVLRTRLPAPSSPLEMHNRHFALYKDRSMLGEQLTKIYRNGYLFGQNSLKKIFCIRSILFLLIVLGFILGQVKKSVSHFSVMVLFCCCFTLVVDIILKGDFFSFLFLQLKYLI